MKIPVSKTYALVDDEFKYLAGLTWHTDSDGYAINFKNKVRMHKLICRGREIDHINGNKLDNRRSNLRIVTHQQNIHNAKAHRDGTSRYKGVSRRRNGFRAQICHNGDKMTVGTFPTEHFAVLAYDLWANSLGRKTNLPLAS